MYTRTIQILGHLSTTLRVALYWSPLHKQCALILHTLTSWICVAGCHWNICVFRLFQCVGSNFVCHFIRDCQTLSVQDLSDTSRCHLIHWGACTVISHTHALALCRPRTGFCRQALEFWSILFHAIPTKRKKYVECVYNSIFCISEYIPDRAQPPFRHRWKQSCPLSVSCIWWPEGFCTDLLLAPYVLNPVSPSPPIYCYGIVGPIYLVNFRACVFIMKSDQSISQSHPCSGKATTTIHGSDSWTQI